jgi:Ca2+-transporting ATPase
MANHNSKLENSTDFAYNQPIEILFRKYNAQANGLSSLEALSLKKSVGLNKIPKKKRSFYKKYIKPVINMMMIILLIAALVQIYFVYYFNVGSYFSPISILIILLINITIGMLQQYSASRTMAALEKLTSFKSVVLRDGHPAEINADALVPGDILLLKQGDYIAADARLFEINNLEVNESNLTGETQSVQKSIQNLSEKDLIYQDQTNMVFCSTFITSGNAKALVTATGSQTVIGKISKGIAKSEHKEIPLNKQMNRLGIGLGLLVIVVVSSLFLYQYLPDFIRDQYLPETTVIIEEISWLVLLAVAAIPFNFPLITTIILLTGAMALAKKQAVVRNLSAVETMGRLTVICSDKTGTLTRNEMTVQKLYQANNEFSVTGLGYQPQGKINYNGEEIIPSGLPFLWKLFINGIVNNNSDLITEQVAIKKGSTTVHRVIGIPTEGALLTLAEKANINPAVERKAFEVLKEFSFTSERKKMSKIVKRKDKITCFSKGAPELLLELCSHVVVNNKILQLTMEIKKDYLSKIQEFSSSGLRTLGFAYRNLDVNKDYSSSSSEEIEKNLIFLGIAGIRDPPRKGVKKSIENCKKAGVKVVMITGDHPDTAKAIAKQINIYKDDDIVISGSALASLKPEEIVKVSVFARVAPEDKDKIVKDFQSQGHLIAMTGDGVNDTLALENANVGIAMGISGTDVAKNAADLVLTDDSFNTIENAIFHGRGLFNNIRSNTVFLLACALIELTVLSVGYLVFQKQIFTGFQLIILYISVHFFPPWGLMFDKYSKKMMNNPPKKLSEQLVNKKFLGLLIIQIITVSCVLIVLWVLINNETYPLLRENFQDVIYTNPFDGISYSGYVFDEERYLFSEGENLDLLRLFKGQTICMITLIFSEIWIVYEARSIRKSIFQGIFNFALTILVLIVVAILAFITQYDLAQAYINIVTLSPIDWGIAFGSSLIVIIISKLYKLIIRKPTLDSI